MKLNLLITNFKPEITAVIGRKDNIQGFANWIFTVNGKDWKIKGGMIKIKEFGEKKLLTFDSPAYKTKFKYHKVLFIDDLEVYKQLCKATIDEYINITGELPNGVTYNEEVDLDEIPI